MTVSRPLASRSLLLSVLMMLAGCAGTPPVDREPDETAAADPMLAGSGISHVVVKEAFITPLTPEDNVDSPALWLAPDGSALLLATGKKTGHLVAYDGDTGKSLGVRGSRGAGAGQFDRPNGIFIHGDLLFVVERDNHRVQVLRLPAMQPLGSFGTNELRKPYGIWLRATGNQRYDVLVTDAYMDGEDVQGNEIVPPLATLGERVRRYDVTVKGDALQAKLVASIGDTGEAGAIRVPESVWGDEANDRLLIAEEDLPTGTAVREYGMDGRFRGRTIGLGSFKAQAEGISLWQCADGSGYWITTDQFKDRSLFHVWDRRSLQHIGAFAGETVGNTDGVWLQQGATRAFPQGVFYAVHDDMGVGAFDWRDVAHALGLKESCAP